MPNFNNLWAMYYRAIDFPQGKDNFCSQLDGDNPIVFEQYSCFVQLLFYNRPNKCILGDLADFASCIFDLRASQQGWRKTQIWKLGL